MAFKLENILPKTITGFGISSIAYMLYTCADLYLHTSPEVYNEIFDVTVGGISLVSVATSLVCKYLENEQQRLERERIISTFD